MKPARWLPLALFAALVVLLAAGVWLSGNPDRDALPSPLLGKQAPAFSLPLLHQPDQRLSSESLRGSPYVLNVWGSWCPECRTEHPVLARLSASGRVRLVGYNWKDEREDALRWLQQFGDPYWAVVADDEGRTAIDWGVYGAPETFLVDGDGVIRWKHVGPVSDADVQDGLLPALERIGAGR
jgi:cytochrome c biogenesis protein CcmG, thiol:disulfide interchange protein DsbE